MYGTFEPRVENFPSIEGKRIVDVFVGRKNTPEKYQCSENIDFEDAITFVFDNDTIFVLHHWQDCCESVGIHGISGYDLEDLKGSKVISFEKVTVGDTEEKATFYKLQTDKGFSTIAFYGFGNGYYSLEVSEETYTFEELNDESEFL